MAKFTVIRVADKGEGRLIRVSQHTDSLLAGRRAWCWLTTAMAVGDVFELPDGSFKYTTQEIESPDGEPVTITMLEAC